MNDPRGQQPIVSGSPNAPSGYPMQPAYYPPQAPARKPGFFAVLGRTLRLLLRRLLYLLVIVGRVLRPVAVPLAIVLVMGSVIAWMSYQIWGPKPGVPADVRVKSIAPAPAVESYVKGQQSFNAEMMWSTYSADYQSAQLQRGATKEALQAQADNQRLQGLKYEQYEYVGGVPMDGGGMYFYAVQLELQGRRAKLPLVITVDGDGKIAKISWPLSDS